MRAEQPNIMPVMGGPRCGYEQNGPIVDVWLIVRIIHEGPAS